MKRRREVNQRRMELKKGAKWPARRNWKRSKPVRRWTSLSSSNRQFCCSTLATRTRFAATNSLKWSSELGDGRLVAMRLSDSDNLFDVVADVFVGVVYVVVADDAILPAASPSPASAWGIRKTPVVLTTAQTGA